MARLFSNLVLARGFIGQTVEDHNQLTCLCFASFEQTTYNLPFLLTTLQPSQNFFTELLTFIPLIAPRLIPPFPPTAVAASGAPSPKGRPDRMAEEAEGDEETKGQGMNVLGPNVEGERRAQEEQAREGIVVDEERRMVGRKERRKDMMMLLYLLLMMSKCNQTGPRREARVNRARAEES